MTMTVNQWKEIGRILLIALGILALTILLLEQGGCQSADVKSPERVEIGDGDYTGPEMKQVTNSVWPWMVAVIAMPVLFLAYLFISKKFTGFGIT